MDRRIILAVAGSGKTTFLIEKLDLEKRFLVVTYTENNLSQIRSCIIHKFGFIPQNITLLSYFQFLIHVCYRPFLKDIINAKSITWEKPDLKTSKFKRSDIKFYMTSNRYLYYNRIAKLCMDKCAGLIKGRIEKYYDFFMVDEVQDFGGHDFNLLLSIIPTSISCLFVGDYFQHTFDTSDDGNVNSGLYKDYVTYKNKWLQNGIIVDETTLSNSHRCTQSICDFVSTNLHINIASNRHDNTNIYFIKNPKDAESLFYDTSKVKLFLQEASKYPCFAENWGKAKGLDNFIDVCIVLNKTTLKAYNNHSLYLLAPATLNKLYVACTRAKGDIYFIPHSYIDRFKNG